MSKKSQPEYWVWAVMIQRCTNPRNKQYPNYGGRGINVCAAWRQYANFIADMGRRPDDGMLERIDNDKGYSLDNCRWATRTEQNRNRRSVKLEPHEPDQIRWLVSCGYRPVQVARFFGISKEHANAVLTRRIWA